ncbi:MAG: sugar kinase [Planctomycetes bacterium]|nr:sugar kinase [Planctomycetota bacterium]
MSILVVGSIALDTVETPHGRREDLLGGSATHFSYAASLFGPVRLVGVVGEDFPSAHLEALAGRGVDTSGVTVVPGGRSFRWSGSYSPDMNSRETRSVELNVFGTFRPLIPRRFADSRFVFLANGAPATQACVLDQVGEGAFTVCDTMDLWIATARADLLALLGRVDGVVVNDGEARALTGEGNTTRAASRILEMGPRYVVIKKGEHGCLLVGREGLSLLPAYPVEVVRDPTGAGDSFAGALMGALARDGAVDFAAMRRALVDATVVASFNVEAFGVEGLRDLRGPEMEARRARFLEMVSLR